MDGRHVSMKSLAALLEQNRRWSEGRTAADPDFFRRLSGIQQPDHLWIGCSDSRVPANQILGLEPGEIFVHRNIANIVDPNDVNCMAVVQYAVAVLHVRQILVCGHYGCGGVRAVIEDSAAPYTHVDRWLAPLKEIARTHESELSRLDSIDRRIARLCELNVIGQVRRLRASDVLRGREVVVHGIIYDIHDGLLHRLEVS